MTADFVAGLEGRPEGKLILVTAINPTPAGEGKTTTTIGLGDALNRLGKRTAIALREPSLGPCFGQKGGATGGGRAQIAPMDEINLHFTGDFHAITSAHNLLAAMLDNHVYWGNALDIDARRVSWRRALDMNDRALREITVGLGGVANGFPRSDGFDITVASEVMAVFCLSHDLVELEQRLGGMIVAETRAKTPVYARDLKAASAMTALLARALEPNLVQTLEGSPALVHGGPFANIAHGCNSIVATKAALRLADYVVTEAGFGADLGAEKFFNIKCRLAGLKPAAAVVVATVRALKMNGGVAKANLGAEDLEALRRGLPNLERHVENVAKIRDRAGGRDQPFFERYGSRTRARARRDAGEGRDGGRQRQLGAGRGGRRGAGRGRSRADRGGPSGFPAALSRRSAADAENSHDRARDLSSRRRRRRRRRRQPAAAVGGGGSRAAADLRRQDAIFVLGGPDGARSADRFHDADPRRPVCAPAPASWSR